VALCSIRNAPEEPLPMAISSDIAFVVDAMITALAEAWPLAVGSPDNRLAAASKAVEALKPDDLAEIMIATRMLAAHHASMDSYRRSMRPGLCDADVSRLRANALATGRAADAAQRTLDKRKAPPKPPAEARPARKPPVPPHEDMSRIEAELARFTPEEIAAAEISLDNDPADLARNELAKRVSLDRFEDMTMEERRIAYAPRALMTPAEIAVMGKRIAESNRRPRPADEVAPGEPQARST
jgi:hypothetical protein